MNTQRSGGIPCSETCFGPQWCSLNPPLSSSLVHSLCGCEMLAINSLHLFLACITAAVPFPCLYNDFKQITHIQTTHKLGWTSSCLCASFRTDKPVRKQRRVATWQQSGSAASFGGTMWTSSTHSQSQSSVFILILSYQSPYQSPKLDFDSLAEAKNWSSWNEIIETSGRLHPLRPQNKQLHTQIITDYKHTRQDRRIQKEMASTHTKSATKPNSSKILQLQTARKKINWTT